MYVVEHATRQRLALKCLLPEHLGSPSSSSASCGRRRPPVESSIRNVVDVFDVGRRLADLLVMELLEGKPLGEILRDDQLGLEEVLQIMLRAMEAWPRPTKRGSSTATSSPTTSSSASTVGSAGHPRVLDFGISKLEYDVSNPLTRAA